MSFTVGLDFGTHQTKVCIEDATNPAQKTYEFVEFNNPFGNPTLLFPSIVQINEDDTLSYGFVNDESCKWLHNEGKEKPKFEPLKEPILELPIKPGTPIFPDRPIIQANSWREKIQRLFSKINQNAAPEIIDWKKECTRIQNNFNIANNEWKRECGILQEQYNEILIKWRKQNEKIEIDYKNDLSEWKENLVEKFYYRYFKLAAFSNSVQWNHKIDSDKISVWFITYILLILQEKLGENFFVQMGIPSGTNHDILKNQTEKAYALLITAYKLVEKYKTKEDYLKEKYTNLLNLIELQTPYSEDDIYFYGLKVIPEAYAGLSSITQQKRLEYGMSLLVDIGGGTTDVVFFTIGENQPDIHTVHSFPKGLNYIFENYIKENPRLSIPDVQKIFLEKKGDESLFHNTISQYHDQLLVNVKNMVSKITKSFESRRPSHHLSSSKLMKALENRPVVYCGGGSIYSSMQTTLLNFNDIKLVNGNLLNIPFIKNQHIDEILYTILATSYGLSIPLENDIIITPIEKVFDHIEAPKTDKGGHYDYDHGLSDF